MMNLKELVEVYPEKMSGTPVFHGTRVPIKNLFDCLEAGEDIDEFLDQFPSVTREQVVALVEASRENLLADDQASIDLRARGITEEQAAELRARLSAFDEDWKRTELAAYDAI